MTVAASPAEGVTPRSRISEWLIWCAIAMLLAIRLAVSLHDLGGPGLQQDETLFVNAATLRIPGFNIPHAVDGVPLMVFPYIGALKSWLYAPVFSIFGESPTSIRFPAIVIVSLGLAMVYPAIRDLVNRPVALMAFISLCFENSIFWLTRDDVGPSALEFFFKCAGLLLAARFARTRGWGWLVALLLSLGLGVFNKLNYIWVVNTAVVASAAVIVAHRHELRAYLALLTIWCGGLIVIYGCFAWYYFAEHIGTIMSSGSGLTQPWSDYGPGMARILSGTWFYAYALAPISMRLALVWIVIALFVIGAAASVAAPGCRSLPVAALAVATLLIALQVLVTKQATAGWHYIAIFPSVLIVAAYGLWVATASMRGSSMSRAALPTIATCAFLAYSGVLMDHYYRSLHREPSFVAWTPAIYDLSAYLSRLPGRVYTADWGIADPLFALHPGQRFNEFAFALANPDPATLRDLGQQVAASPGPKYVVTHVPAYQVFPGADRNMHIAFGRHLSLLTTIDGPGRQPVYDVYAFR